MSKEEKIKDWLTVARLDWKRIIRNLEDKDSIAAGFYLQQSLEKYLKAFLILHGWKLKKIHRLDILLNEAAKYLPELTSYNSFCKKISPYYIADRYPPIGNLGITQEDILKDMEVAKEMVKQIFPKEELNA